MTRWIALLRGINVGGKNIIKMADLKRDLESLKLQNVRTYIQSGNVVFDSKTKTASTLRIKILATIEKQHGFRPALFLLDRNELLATIKANPFHRAEADPKTLHFFFLSKPATAPNIQAIDNAQIQSERSELTAAVFYLHAPDGIGRSKLATNVEKYLGVTTTARNFRTIETLKAMAMES